MTIYPSLVHCILRVQPNQKVEPWCLHIWRELICYIIKCLRVYSYRLCRLDVGTIQNTAWACSIAEVAHPQQVSRFGSIVGQRCMSLEGTGWVTDSRVTLRALTFRLISTVKCNRWHCLLMLGDIKAPLFCHQLWLLSAITSHFIFCPALRHIEVIGQCYDVCFKDQSNSLSSGMYPLLVFYLLTLGVRLGIPGQKFGLQLRSPGCPPCCSWQHQT
jgi:hypothetical protein